MRYSKLSLAILFVVIAFPVHAQTFYTTGTYTVDAAHSVTGNAVAGRDSSNNSIDSLGHPYNPTVNLVTGGSIGGSLGSFNSSTFNVNDGRIAFGGYADLNAYDSSIVNQDFCALLKSKASADLHPWLQRAKKIQLAALRPILLRWRRR